MEFVRLFTFTWLIINVICLVFKVSKLEIEVSKLKGSPDE